MIVVTLSKVPPSLRGALTRWYQEVQTGVYVGSVSARVRDQLWARITRDIGSGEATMVYSARNELGYAFVTTRHDHQVVDFDGIPLMLRTQARVAAVKPGFSDAAHFHQAKQAVKKRRAIAAVVPPTPEMVALDLETSGLTPGAAQIIAIGAARVSEGATVAHFSRLIAAGVALPAAICDLTGLTEARLATEGVPLGEALTALREFVGDRTIVGYNLPFDDKFLAAALRAVGTEPLANPRVDLVPVVKRAQKFLDNYQLATVLEKYGIINDRPHDALADAEATLALAQRLVADGRLKL
ncbi:type I-E CRISPR-associated endoribonuclease Cas2e [Lacticaseibacillus kribbianus]|uniref:type I-E CRISPR-associated endoribonuclease Cas2e n=1 Tax=Lacticaseibacillus kribbianus TaxID=2926292 RepID=UPI001CD36A6E|nr:type I-E CRISPR-associated endoribonuclease Cas2e [Lacticaseibacillus kribbianus]